MTKTTYGNVRSRRGRLVSLNGTVAIYECPRGHRTKKDHSKGPQTRRMSATALQMFEKYWKDGVNFSCRKCSPFKNGVMAAVYRNLVDAYEHPERPGTYTLAGEDGVRRCGTVVRVFWHGFDSVATTEPKGLSRPPHRKTWQYAAWAAGRDCARK